MTSLHSSILQPPSPPSPRQWVRRELPETDLDLSTGCRETGPSSGLAHAPSPGPSKRKRRSPSPGLFIAASPDSCPLRPGSSMAASAPGSTEPGEPLKSLDPNDLDGYQLDDGSVLDLLPHSDHETDQLESKDGLESAPEDETAESKYSLHIEVRLRSHSTILYHTVRNAIARYLTDNFTTLQTHAPVPGWQDLKFLIDEVYSVYCAECTHPLSLVPIRLARLNIHVYELPVKGEDKITMLCANPTDSSDFGHDAHDNEEDTTGDVAASKIQLPAYRLEGVWESLVYENELKIKLLNYIYSSIIFAQQNVNQNLIAWHRLVLLHGPPGTGKTSLCKSLAQKVSIRLSGIYQKTELVEINSHSLFSKWFSESGKLVHSLFTKIEQIAEDSDVFVLVLIDEVESLAGCRSSGASGGEPSDALRAVNSLLTALDKLRHYKNVLVLTTSNLTGSIDEAFLDRADMKQFIPLPSSGAIYWILQTCLQELMDTQILTPRRFLDHREALMVREEVADQSTEQSARKTDLNAADNPNGESTQRADGARSGVDKKHLPSMKLLEISETASGLSGRSLRRLPLLAHARTSGAVLRPTSGGTCRSGRLNADVYLDAMLDVALESKSSRI